MKYKIHFLILGTTILVSLLLVFFYYSQDFQENIEFNKNISYSEIELEFRNASGEVYVSRATAKLGSIKLVNEGIFPQKYNLPEFLGCVELTGESGISYLSFNAEPSSYLYSDEYITIYPGDSKTLDIYGVYSPSYSRISFTRDQLGNITLFKIPNKQQNPLGSYYYNSKSSCQNYMNNEQPFTLIEII